MAKRFVYALEPLLKAKVAEEKMALKEIVPFIQRRGQLELEESRANQQRHAWVGRKEMGSELRIFLKKQLAFLSKEKEILEKEIIPYEKKLQAVRSRKKALELLREEKYRLWKKENRKQNEMNAEERARNRYSIAKKA